MNQEAELLKDCKISHSFTQFRGGFYWCKIVFAYHPRRGECTVWGDPCEEIEAARQSAIDKARKVLANVR